MKHLQNIEGWEEIKNEFLSCPAFKAVNDALMFQHIRMGTSGYKGRLIQEELDILAEKLFASHIQGVRDTLDDIITETDWENLPGKGVDRLVELVNSITPKE